MGDIREATRNPKAHADATIRESISRFGYVEPMVLDERTGQLVAGHGRLSALRVAKQAGQAAPQGVQADGEEWLVPVLRGWASRSDVEAEAYLLASNKLTEAGGWELSGLAKMLEELGAADALDGTGFTDADIEALLEKTGAKDVKEPDFSSELRFQILVDCKDEGEQTTLLTRLESEGLRCKPLML
jgi:hypothetical protein